MTVFLVSIEMYPILHTGTLQSDYCLYIRKFLMHQPYLEEKTGQPANAQLGFPFWQPPKPWSSLFCCFNTSLRFADLEVCWISQQQFLHSSAMKTSLMVRTIDESSLLPEPITPWVKHWGLRSGASEHSIIYSSLSLVVGAKFHHEVGKPCHSKLSPLHF